MGIPVAIIDGLSYYCRAWKSTPGQRLVASWNKGWQGGMGEAFRESPNRYMFGEKIDSSRAGYLRAHPKILASIEDADIDATLPVYCIEGTMAAGSVTFDAGTRKSVTAAASATLEHAVAVQADRILIVTAAWTSGGISSGTFGGKPLTRLGGAGTPPVRTDIWYLVNPPTGTNILRLTLNGSLTGQISCISLYNVHQATPFR